MAAVFAVVAKPCAASARACAVFALFNALLAVVFAVVAKLCAASARACAATALSSAAFAAFAASTALKYALPADCPTAYN